MAFAYSPKIVTDGLVFAVDAANTKSYPGSGTTWKDLSGNGNDGTLTNGPTFDYGNGGSLVFDGSNDYVQSIDLTGNFISNPDLNGNIISFTFFVNVLSSSSYYIISSGGQTSGAAGIAFSYQNGTPFVAVKGLSGGFKLDITESDFPINQWIGWSVVCTSSQLNLYKNGLFLGSQNSQNANPVGNDGYTTLTIGRPNNLDGLRANMNFSNLNIYNKALTDQEVLQNYNALKSRFGL